MFIDVMVHSDTNIRGMINSAHIWGIQKDTPRKGHSLIAICNPLSKAGYEIISATLLDQHLFKDFLANEGFLTIATDAGSELLLNLPLIRRVEITANHDRVSSVHTDRQIKLYMDTGHVWSLPTSQKIAESLLVEINLRETEERLALQAEPGHRAKVSARSSKSVAKTKS